MSLTDQDTLPELTQATAKALLTSLPDVRALYRSKSTGRTVRLLRIRGSFALESPEGDRWTRAADSSLIVMNEPSGQPSRHGLVWVSTLNVIGNVYEPAIPHGASADPASAAYLGDWQLDEPSVVRAAPPLPWPPTPPPAKGITQEDLDSRFRHHTVSGSSVLKMASVRLAARDFATLVTKLTPPGREQSLAITALEEAVSWANAGIARATEG